MMDYPKYWYCGICGTKCYGHTCEYCGNTYEDWLACDEDEDEE